jgi:hypothetical protein
MTIDPVLIFLIVIAGLAALVYFRLFQKKQAKAQQSESTCGTVAHPGGTLIPSAWHIGPRSRVWGNRSPGMPEHPAAHPEGFSIDIPTSPTSQVGYVTFNHGSLTGKHQIRMRYRVELEEGAKLYAVREDNPQPDGVTAYPAMMTMYFQRAGDDWSAGGPFETYRWFAARGRDNYLREGEHELLIPLSAAADIWSATQGSVAVDKPVDFVTAKDNACCVGFVFGGNERSVGHGMRSTAPARLVVMDFIVE